MGKKEAAAQLQQREMDVLRKYVKANKSALPDQIVFAGSSLMEMFPIEKMQQNLELKQKIYNRGVSGTTTQFLLQHIDELVLDLQPAKIFINIGSNDIDFGISEKTFISNYASILQTFQQKPPQTTVYTMAYYPMNPTIQAAKNNNQNSARSNERLAQASQQVAQLADKFGYEFINVNDGLADENGDLLPKLTFDGVHMFPAGYEIVLKNMYRYL
ncbi:GDSL-type esterase/lipase family protein [Weissella paramesenteroides]|uniref:GDSL-type esterase/lipase family protein n=1 Tax=Weissella paramesenteroides TaxID=1249 RepID=UPI001238BFBE|nr:GDSL-type esterase/lipase family protein [Weissella paramesenteroides]KAA8447831.1 lysophospholipase [Weissella paramesenteroides]KAA8450456.1 lysophospholipase [Weissella paramesenteroides]